MIRKGEWNASFLLCNDLNVLYEGIAVKSLSDLLENELKRPKQKGQSYPDPFF
jgi:hypothetical protein